jgi:hypothetical protein
LVIFDVAKNENLFEFFLNAGTFFFGKDLEDEKKRKPQAEVEKVRVGQ